jgi:alpha-beta hydrolase superfamily lysophospholipase
MPDPDPSVADDAGCVCGFLTSDGMRLRYRHWRPSGAPRAFVIGLHGIQSHSGWYGYSSRTLAEAGIDVRFLDRRNAGLNLQDRTQAAGQARLIDDVVEFVRQVDDERRRGASLATPLLLLGVSWGARLAAAACDSLGDVCNGLILLYPGIWTRVRPTALQQRLLRLTESAGGGRLTVSLPLAAEQFTSQPQWQDFIRHDPLAMRRVSVSFLLAGERLRQLALVALERLTLPRLVMLAGQDEIVDLPRTRDFLGRMPAESLRVVEYPQARHTLEFESGRERYVADLIHWVESIGCRYPS